MKSIFIKELKELLAKSLVHPGMSPTISRNLYWKFDYSKATDISIDDSEWRYSSFVEAKCRIGIDLKL